MSDQIKARVLPTTRIDAVCDEVASSRYALGCVQVIASKEPGHVYAAATDGCCAAITEYAGEVAPDLGCVLMPQSMVHAPTAKGKARNPAILNGQWTRNEKTAPAIDSRFPRLFDVFPSIIKEDCFVIGLSGEILANLAKAIGNEKGELVLFIQRDNTNSQPVVVVGNHGIGLLMPCDVEDNRNRKLDALPTSGEALDTYQATLKAYTKAKTAAIEKDAANVK